MIIQKFNKQFTDSELNAYLTSINAIQGRQSAQVDEAWRTLGYINASAFKGYGHISDEAAAYNCKVYRTKEQAICILAQHTDNIATSGSVLYIRTLDGIQISFHLRGTKTDDALAPYENNSIEWDGVQNSYTYTDINAYNAARAEYQRKRQEDADKLYTNSEALRNAIVKMLRNANTRKMFGLTSTREEVEAINPFQYFRSVDIDTVLLRYGINYGNPHRYEAVQRVLKNMGHDILSWKAANIFNFND